jgi:peptide/nickel transport system substrate-binding protein
MRRTTKARVLAAGLAVALLAAACGGDDGDGGAATGTTGGPATTVAKTPVTGGTLTFANFSEPASLDSMVSTGSGTTGGTEMAMVFDTIARYNPQSKKYEPRTAESITPNADFTEWTVKLRPNIKFSDGTAYDAEAVVWGLNRHRVGTGIPAAQCATYFACPRNTTSSGVYMALVKDIQVVDPVTFKVTMNQAWPGFQYALSDEAAMIPSKAALAKACTDATQPVRTCAFGLAPVGAGPFLVQGFKPKEVINFVRNPNYWGGPVRLDAVNVISPNDQGGAKTYDTFKSGTAQAAYLRSPSSVDESKKDAAVSKATSFSELNYGGGLILFNMGTPVTCTGGQPANVCAGKADGTVTESDPPTKRLKVRQAVAAAIDPKQINTRANNGVGLPGSEVFQKGFNWDPGVPGPKYDLDLAKKLVAEAKAEGWDGRIRMLYSNGQFAVDVAQTTASMLQAAGFTVDVDTSKDTTAQVTQVATRRDFDLSGWGTNITNDDGYIAALAQNLSSTSPSNRVGLKNTAVDKAIQDLWSAKTDAERTSLNKIIAEELNKEVPWYVWSAIEARVIFSNKVNGVQQNHSGVFFLHDAWLEK